MRVEANGKHKLLGVPDDLDNCRVSTILEEMITSSELSDY